MRTDVRIRQFAPVVIDEPPALGGENAGPNPMEYVLASLIGCASVMLRIISAEQNFAYENAEFDVQGTLDLRGLEGTPGVCRHYQQVTGNVQVKTADADKLAQVAAAIESRCPVFNLLKDAGTDIHLEWQAV